MGIEQLTPVQLTMKQKPTAAAKLMDIRPQYIYQYIKQGCPSHESAIGPMVIIEEIIKWRGPKGIPSGNTQATNNNGEGQQRRTAPKVQVSSEFLIRAEKERIERTKGVFENTFWLPGYRPQPLEFDSVLTAVSDGIVKLKSTSGLLKLCSQYLTFNGADRVLVEKLDAAVEELVKAGYNVSITTADEVPSTAAPVEVEEEHNDGDELPLGQEEVGDGS